jgi:hypothetical protein
MKSALQKYIRRGHTEQALYAANELYMFKHLDGGQAAYTNFINRIRVITLEDVGLGSPFAVIYIDALLKKLSTNIPDEELFIGTVASIVYTLSNTLHHRFYSHIKNFIFDKKIPEHSEYKNEYPIGKDAAFQADINSLIWSLEENDITVVKWILTIFNSDQKLNTKRYRSTQPRFLVMDVIEWFLKRKGTNLQIFMVCLEWLKTLKVKEAFLCALHPVYVYMFKDVLSQPGAPQSVPDVITCIQNNFLDTYSPAKNIHSYIQDKHTQAGRSTRKKTSDFAVEGSLVAYEDNLLRYAIARKHGNLEFMYIQARLKDGAPQESQVFKLKTRAQLTCSVSRPDVYYAFEGKDNVVVKGPFLEYESVNKSYQIFRLMSLFPQVNTIDANIKILYPDMFASVPIGIRNKTLSNKPYYFLVLKDVFDQDAYPEEIKQSKCWPPTKVVNYTKLFHNHQRGFATPLSMSETAKVSLIYQLSWRRAFEIGDFAARNMCFVGDKAYNLDSDDIFVGTTLKWKLTERQCLTDTFIRHRQEILDVWTEWLTPGNWSYDRWFMIKRIMALGDSQIETIRANIRYLLSSFEEWLLSPEKNKNELMSSSNTIKTKMSKIQECEI